MVKNTSNFLGNGWAFPIRPSQGGGLEFKAGATKIRQSIWIILSTAPGERLMLPEFGCDIHDLTFQPNSASLRGNVREKVVDSLTKYEPRIDVIEVKVESFPEERNRIDIEIDFRIRANNSFHNLVYPFFLLEGRS